MTAVSDDHRTPADAATEGWMQLRRNLQEEMGRGRGPWMALPVEDLPRFVTPLTHSLYCRFLTSPEGMPAVMRTLGFEPAMDGGLDGLLVHIAGRSMLDVSKVPSLFSSFDEVEYDQDLLRSQPRMIFHHPLTPLGGDDGRLLRLTKRRLELIASDFHARLEKNSLPLFKEWVGARSEMGFGRLSEHVLTDQWREMVEQIWFWMVGDLVLARCISGLLSADVLALVWDKSEPDELDDLMGRLLVCSAVTPGLRMRDALHGLGNGKIDLDAWLSEFGYRGPAEWDLAEKRWREMPEALEEKARVVSSEGHPLDQHQSAVAAALDLEESLAGRMARRDRARFLDGLFMWRRYEAVIQEVEDSVLQGLNMMRAIALEMGRRTELESDIFYLTEKQLIGAVESAMPVWKDCDERKHRLMDQRDYPVPAFIGDDELAQWEEILVRAGSEPQPGETASDLTGEEDMRLAAGYMPPALAPDERRSIQVGWLSGLLWVLVLLPLVSVFPGQGGRLVWSVMDRLLGPIGAFAGRPGAAVMLGVSMAFVLALFQRILPAFHRWAEMYHRTRLLEKSEADWPEDTPRRRLIQAVSEHARKRLARGRASGLLLVWGALALVCGWLAIRLNTGGVSGAASVAVVSAVVPEGVSGELRLEPAQGVELEAGEQADRMVRPFRELLENQLQSWKSESDYAREGRPRPPEPMLHALADFLQSPQSEAQVFQWRLVQASSRPGEKRAELLLGGERVAEIPLFTQDAQEDTGMRQDSNSLSLGRQTWEIDSPAKDRVTSIAVRYEDLKGDTAGPNGGSGILGPWVNTGWVGAFLLGFLGVYLPMRGAFRFP